MSAVKSFDADHKCFGCGKQVTDHECHIHVGMDEWAGREGLGDPIGMDDLFTFVFCESCCEDRPDGGWQYESHSIETTTPGGGDDNGANDV